MGGEGHQGRVQLVRTSARNEAHSTQEKEEKDTGGNQFKPLGQEETLIQKTTTIGGGRGEGGAKIRPVVQKRGIP